MGGGAGVLGRGPGLRHPGCTDSQDQDSRTILPKFIVQSPFFLRDYETVAPGFSFLLFGGTMRTRVQQSQVAVEGEVGERGVKAQTDQNNNASSAAKELRLRACVRPLKRQNRFRCLPKPETTT